jgi:hypothetical protein
MFERRLRERINAAKASPPILPQFWTDLNNVTVQVSMRVLIEHDGR